jgi:DNA-binding XRE family transcriptional regulator
MKTQPTKLHARMLAMNINDRHLAKIVDIDRSMITKLRHGRVTASLELAVKICEVTGIRPKDLIVTDTKRKNEESK